MLLKKNKPACTLESNLRLTVQFYSLFHQEHRLLLPRKCLHKWTSAALEQSAELTLRFVDIEEAQQLNLLYRQKNYIPNVLTFAYNEESYVDNQSSHKRESTTPEIKNQLVFADIVLCCKKIEEEAIEQCKSLIAHYAHLIVHGTLHAQGYDHQKEDDAIKMEAKEIEILKKLGFSSPYL